MISLHKELFAVLAILIFPGLISLPLWAADVEDFYAGKDITVLVGFQAGGTVRIAQEFARAWGKYIPGRPDIIVKSMPGGGGTTALNYLYERARPDGLTLVWGSFSPVSWALGEQQLRANFEDLEIISGITSLRVSYVRTDVVPGGMEQPVDILRAEGLKTCGVVLSGVLDMLVRMPLDLLGVDYRHVSGFRGGGTGLFAAMKRGEVHMHNVNITAYRTRSVDEIRSGEMMGLYYFAYVDDYGNIEKNPYMNDLQSFPEFYQQIYGRLPSGPRWEAMNWLVGIINRLGQAMFAPPGTPDPVLKELRGSFANACKDPELQDTAKKRFGMPYICVDADTGRQIIDDFVNVKPTIVDELRLAIRSGVSFY